MGHVQTRKVHTAGIVPEGAAERRQSATNSLLELFARKNSRDEYLDSVVDILRKWSGCQGVGIRIVDGQGNVPYRSQVGLADDFCRLENHLSLQQDACLCTRAVGGESLPSDRPVRTAGGSFRCDDVPAFAARLTPEQLPYYRTACFHHGFASLAVVPVVYRGQVLGAIHLADPRKGMASEETISFIESMSPLIGEALHRFSDEAELSAYHDHLEDLVLRRTDELRRAAQELARSNEDLAQFASVASHDLQEPLRAVEGFVSLLKRKCQGQLDDEANGFIDSAVEGVERMQSLIHDLLAYSRVGASGKSLTPADVRESFQAALENLRTSIGETAAVVTADPLPSVAADPSQLTQLFQNLIANAIKFRGNRRPEIHVAARREPDAWLFSVRDNGIGIDPQDADRIFLIFQRLHKRKDYPGTGIGLAICKKIVERHGGRIWVESQRGQGAAFYFTIPAREPPASSAAPAAPQCLQT